MPIIIKDFDWNQTENTVTIKVPLKCSKVDLFTSPTYIKCSYEQYFFEVFLSYPVVIEKSKCLLANESIVFELEKCEKKIWDELEIKLPKEEKLALKLKIINEEHNKLQQICTKKVEQKAELKRTAVKEQISLETKQRETIQNIKESEKQNALGDLKVWQESTTLPEESSYVETIKAPITLKSNRENNKTLEKPIPKLRNTSTVEVSFTPREFPTPSRESRLEEENEWLKKQAEARRSVGFVCEDLRPEEKNPQYLKSRGDEFFKSGNYLGAISAYSFGIKLCDKYVDLYIARSRAQFAIGNFHKVIDDCSKALDLMKPEVPANLKERSVCIGRRGAALCKLGLTEHGNNEISAALKLNSGSEELEKIIHSA